MAYAGQTIENPVSGEKTARPCALRPRVPARGQGPFPPAPIVRAMLAPLAWMAKRKGHGERYAPATPQLAAAL